MGWMEEAQLLMKAVKLAGFYAGFKLWQRERDARATLAALKAAQAKKAAGETETERRRDPRVVVFRPPTLPPGIDVIILLIAAWLSTGASCGKQIIKDAGDLPIYCCDPVEGKPEECVKAGLPVAAICAGYIPRPTPSATPTLAPPQPTPVPTAVPTQVPTPTSAPTPVEGSGHGCRLPVGTGNGENCPRTASQLLVPETAAIDRVIAAHPSWVDPAGTIVLPGHENDFRYGVAAELVSAGLCSFFDGEEVAVKNTNAFSEQYAVLSSDSRIRRGDNSYRATCSPAWKAIPGPTSAPAAETPLLVKIRVGDHCQNPKDGPKYANHICLVTTTNVFRNPRTPDDNQHDSPCDREPALTDFCNGESQDDPRGILYSVSGAEDLGLDGNNSQQATVRFTPGQEFFVCARPYPDAQNSHGQQIRVLGSAESCSKQTQ